MRQWAFLILTCLGVGVLLTLGCTEIVIYSALELLR